MIEQTIPATGATATEPNEIQDEILRSLTLRHQPGDRICVCCYTKNGDGEFHNQQTFVDGIDAANHVIESNYMKPDVGAIWTNLQKLQAGATARNPETIEAYVNLLIDIDRRDKDRPLLDAQGKPVLDEHGKARLEHINATDAEREVLLEQSYAIIKFLTPHFKLPIHADSGNGYHLEYPLAPLAPGIGRQYHETILKIIKAKFERPDLNMAIDTTISNHTRVITVWRTWNRKYPHTPERPQRQTKILSWPKHLRPLSENVLDSFCLENKVIVIASSAPTKKKEGGDFPEVDPRWLEDYGVEHLLEWGMPYTPLDGSSEKGGETYWWLGNCITSDKGTDGFYEHHQGGNKRQTALVLGKTLGIKCFSDDCDGVFTFGDWRRRLEELKGEKYAQRIFLDDGPELAKEFGAKNPDAEPEPIEPNERSDDESYNKKGTLCPTCQEELIGGAQDQECRSCMRKSALREKLQPGEVELTSGNKDGGRVALAILEAHNIETEELVWLWWGRILGSKINLFAGLGDCCKSTVLTDLIARITTGRDFPDGIKNMMGPRRVLLAFTEDDAADTVVPKLTVAGADLTKVLIISKVNGVDADSNPFRRPFNLTDDLTLLEKALRENPDIALVALDPIASFWGKKDSNKDDDMRPVMESLKEMTARHKVALIGILHLNKKTDLKPTQRVGGAGSIANVSRCVWMFSQDPEDKDEYYMAKGKGNLVPRGVKGLKYTTIETPMTFSNGKLGTMFKVDWLGEHEMNADEVSRMEKDVDKGGNVPTMTDQMKLWLREELEKGPRLATEMYDSGDMRFGDGKPKGDEGKKDIGKTLKRAQLAIGGRTTKRRPFYWYLLGYGPNPEEEPHGTEDSQIPVQDVL